MKNKFVFSVYTNDEVLIDLIKDVLNDHPECSFKIIATEENSPQQLDESWSFI